MPSLLFRYLKNHALPFPDERQYPIPVRMYEAPKADVGRLLGSDKALLASFDLDHVHEYPLEDEEPDFTGLESIENEETKKDLRDDARARARDARLKNHSARSFFHAYAKLGVLEIVEDPFQGRPVSPKGRDAKANKDLQELAQDTHKRKAVQAQAA